MSRSRTLPPLLLALLAAACQGDSAPPMADAGPPLTAQEEERVMELAAPAAAALATGLIGRLSEALEEGGPVHAVDFCSMEAIPLTREVETSLAEGLTIKRSALRVRNPANAPDTLEEEALRYFASLAGTGDPLPTAWVQRTPDGGARFYRPLSMAPMCLQCHGDPEAFPPELDRILRERYPEDRAVGYSAGEFRGVIRVTVPASLLAGP